MESKTASLKQSVLLGNQKSLNARCGDEFGWTMARAYGDPIREHQAVRQQVGLLDLSY